MCRWNRRIFQLETPEQDKTNHPIFFPPRITRLSMMWPLPSPQLSPLPHSSPSEHPERPYPLPGATVSVCHLLTLRAQLKSLLKGHGFPDRSGRTPLCTAFSAEPAVTVTDSPPSHWQLRDVRANVCSAQRKIISTRNTHIFVE